MGLWPARIQNPLGLSISGRVLWGMEGFNWPGYKYSGKYWDHGQYVYIKMGEVFNKIGKANYEAILLSKRSSISLRPQWKRKYLQRHQAHHFHYSEICRPFTQSTYINRRNMPPQHGLPRNHKPKYLCRNEGSNNIVSIKSVVKIKSEKMRKVLLGTFVSNGRVQ